MSHTTSIKTTPIKSVTALQTAIAVLQSQGINITLERNAVPRMYYADQIAKHVKSKQDTAQRAGQAHEGLRFHENPEECDYVIKVADAYYDIGLIYNQHGELVPFFDDYQHMSIAESMAKGFSTEERPIRKFLGAQFAGAVEHWSGEREAGEQQLHSVGKLMQQYSIAAACEQAASEGYIVSSTSLDEHGNVHLTIDIN